MSYNSEDSTPSQQRIIWPNMLIAIRLRDPDLEKYVLEEKCKYLCIYSQDYFSSGAFFRMLGDTEL
jgi:hypothetical protein